MENTATMKIAESVVHAKRTRKLNLDYLYQKLLRSINSIFHSNWAADLHFHTAEFKACFLVGIFIWAAS